MDIITGWMTGRMSLDDGERNDRAMRQGSDKLKKNEILP